MFGLSFGELCVLLIVAMVVLGPKELPVYLRKAGQWAGKLRRLAFEMREKSGIDEVLRVEGIDREIAEIRRLARGEMTGITAAVRATADAIRISPSTPALPAGSTPSTAPPGGAVAAGASQPAGDVPGSPYVAPAPARAPVTVDRSREYPQEGADSYGSLPDTAIVYDGTLPASPLAEDALYTRGEAA